MYKLTWELYKIDSAIRKLIENNIDDNGELNPNVEQDLFGLNLDNERLLLDLAVLIKERHRLAEIHKLEAEAQREKSAKALNAAEKLEQMIKNHLPNDKSISDSRISLSYRKSESVVIDYDDTVEHFSGPEWVDRGYARHIPEKYEPDKIALKRAIKSGQQVPNGVKLIVNYNLQVK